MSKRWIAMLLAGGQGTRLGELTDGVAKPAVPFGGKYRIIDYTLSNCSHSRIDTVGVLTQYQPHLLNTYVGHGKAWGLDRHYGGVTILPPYQRNNGGDWYKGTANAVYQNIDYIDHYDPEYVLIISGDHIYQMDYRKLLQFHIEKGADASIAVIQVPLAEAGRFGIMKTDESNRIIEFAEKPSRPTSNLASMGVYLFTWKILKQHLIEDENNPFSTNDFGKDVIPNMLLNEDRLFAYRFNGYWKDVGTIQSLWDANMDLLKKELVVHDSNWEIYSGTTNFPPLYVSPLANIKQSILNEGSIVHGTIINSVLSYNVHVGQGSVIKDSVVMPNVMIGKNVMIEKAIIGSDAIVEDGMVIGSQISPEVTLFTKKERIAASNR